jgi:dihydrofolate reductase
MRAIVACDANGLIGLDGGLPWHLPSELRHFRALTYGHAVVMGRVTFESLPAPLAGRRSVVVTSRTIAGVATVRTLDEAMALASNDAFVIGGARLFAEALPRCKRVYLTRVHASVAVPEGATATYLPRGWWCEGGVEVASGRGALAWTAYEVARPPE